MANRYWVGGSGSWGDTSHWSTTSGGAGGASVPTSADDVYFDNNAGTGTIEITITTASLRKLTVTRTARIRINEATRYEGQFNTYGDIAIAAASDFYVNVQQWLLRGNVTVDFNSSIGRHNTGSRAYLIYILGTATLVSGFSVNNTFVEGTLNLAADVRVDRVWVSGPSGVFNTNNYDVEFGQGALRGIGATGGVVNLGSSKVTFGSITPNSDGVNLEWIAVNGSNADLVLYTGTETFGSAPVTYRLNSNTFKSLTIKRYDSARDGAVIMGSNTFGSLTIDPGVKLTIPTGGSSATTNTVTGSFNANGSAANQIVIRSSTPGLQHVWRKTSGTVDASYLDLKDSAAIGGATWNAHSSVNSGNNSGWNFLGPVAPTASFTASPWSGRAPLTVNFSDTSLGSPTSWLWNFGDGTTSTAQNPTKTYTSPGTYTVSLNVQNTLGGSTTTRTVEATTTVIGVAGVNASASATGSPSITPGAVTRAVGSAVSDTTEVGTPSVKPGEMVIGLAAGEDAASDDAGSPDITQTPPPPPPPTDWEAIGKEDEKVFVYKVYSPDGTFMSVWTDVKDDPQFTQHINTPGTTMTVQLARSPNTTKEVRANLLTEAGDPLTTEDGQRIQVTYETNNNVGEDTDVDLNLNVDVYVHYGEYGYLLTQDGEPITTEDGERLLVASGAPMGVRVFSGFILDYESVYGEETGVTVTLASHGYELSNELIRNGETVNVNYSGQDHADIIKSILDTNPGRMSYDATSIQETGQNVSVKFQLNTKLEGIKSVFDQTPDGWYWFGNPADNLIYLRQRSTRPRHIFYKGKHIKSMRLKRTMEGLTNRVYFVGGEKVEGNPATTLFKKYEDVPSQSQWRVGLERITDRRYTIDASAQNRSMKLINSFSQPVFTTPLTISSARYDLETIKLGDTVGFANFGNFVDSVVLQIVALTYTPTAVTLELGELLERQVDSVAELEDDLNNEQYQKIPDVPS